MRVAQHLPGNDIGMVLHAGDQHCLAGLQHAPAVAVGDEVDGFGAVAHENDFVAVWRIQQCGDGVAGGFVGVGGALAHPMQAAMNIGVLRFHRGAHGIDHGARFLRRGGTVEKNQRFAAHGLRSGSESPRGCCATFMERHGHGQAASLRHQASTALSTRRARFIA